MPSPQRSKAKSSQGDPSGKHRQLSRDVSWEDPGHHRTQSFEVQVQQECSGSEGPSPYFTKNERSTRTLSDNNGTERIAQHAGKVSAHHSTSKSTPTKESNKALAERDELSSESSSKSQKCKASSSQPEVRLPPCMVGENFERLKLLRQANRLPPVTKKSLSELDLDSIQNNVNLRIDICYDHELYFQPISGRKGDLKRRDSENYWTSLAIELQIYQHNCQQPCHQCEGIKPAKELDLMFEPRLSIMFEELKKLLEILVPESDLQEVANHLDIELIMQQVHMGVLDIVRLSSWLFDLLTAHCAPMRDEMAEDMNNQLSRGAETNNAEVLVEGLEKLFAFLEAMKLDVANHQIRTFRWPLIEDTVPFQIDCFQRMIDNGKLDLRGAKEWFEISLREMRKGSAAESRSKGDSSYEAFMIALAGLCNPEQSVLPITFHYDKQRFARLQGDVLDLVQLQSCFSLFDFILEKWCIQHNRATTHAQLAERIMQVVDDDDSEGSSITDNIEAVGIEIARVVSQTAKFPSGRMILNDGDIDVDVDKITNMLRGALVREQEERRITRHFLAALAERTRQNAGRFSQMNTLEISNSQRRWARNRQMNDLVSIVPSLDDMARRLAHIGVVHWKVWSELVYLKDLTAFFSRNMESDGDDDDSEVEDFPGTILSIEAEQKAQVFSKKSSRLSDFQEDTGNPNFQNS